MTLKGETLRENCPWFKVDSTARINQQRRRSLGRLQEYAMAAKPPSILVVDDEEGFRYAATKALQNAGFLVTAASDFRDALDLLDSDAPVDLLITDIVMPERIHGFALARMARMRRTGLKVLYLTAFDVPTSEAAGKVLRKPLTDEQLVEEARLALAG
jgi:CheY-like chemotaxis protein